MYQIFKILLNLTVFDFLNRKNHDISAHKPVNSILGVNRDSCEKQDVPA
jgi:hypothetical protein